jgi:hypothetical protein
MAMTHYSDLSARVRGTVLPARSSLKFECASGHTPEGGARALTHYVDLSARVINLEMISDGE